MLSRGYGRIGAFTDLGHSSLTFESSTDSVIDPLWFPPVLLDALVAVRLVTPGTGLMYARVLSRCTHLKRVVRFFTILMVAAMGCCESRQKSGFSHRRPI